MTKQTYQQGAMQRVIRRRFAIEPHPHFGDPPQQFPMQIVPFPHPHERQKIGLTTIAQLVFGKLARLLMVVIPQLQQTQKIGTLIAEAAMLLVRRLLLFQGTFTRILNRQRGDDHQHFPQATLALRRQQHSPQTRIDRQFG